MTTTLAPTPPRTLHAIALDRLAAAADDVLNLTIADMGTARALELVDTLDAAVRFARHVTETSP